MSKRQVCAKGFPNRFRNGREKPEQTNRHFRIYISREDTNCEWPSSWPLSFEFSLKIMGQEAVLSFDVAVTSELPLFY